MIICRTSVLLEHRDINNDQKKVDIDFFEFFEQAESYIWENILPKEGKVKYPWIDFSKHSVDNKPDSQPPEEVITQSDVEDPPEEVLSRSDIEWEEGETSLSYLGDDGKMYTVYREPQTKVSCNHDQDSLETHPGYPDPDESGPQL